LGDLLRSVKPIYKAGALPITPTGLVNEGSLVACEARSSAELHDGRTYDNEYHFLFTVEGERIASVREYSDTLRMKETFAS
jgi:ketosteroid isomerase-like protein